MAAGECHELTQIKKDWYEKGLDKINIHLYAKEVEEHEIIFEEDQVLVKFSTKHISFLKQHVKGRKKCNFSYALKTRGLIEPSGCHYIVKAPFIEIILKKKIPEKWTSLERFDITDLSVGKKKPKEKVDSPKSSPRKSQLLGGKSTPLTKKPSEDGNQDGSVKCENQQPSSSKTEDQKNIKKAVSTIQAESLLGLIGLENYANNCYMNVVIQILANIYETRDFFKNDHFLKEINSNNPLGSGGKVAKAFADVTKALWSAGKHSFKPAALKSIMGKRCSLFLGWQQHDAQEFFASLLDNLHEDLNQYSGENTSDKDSYKQDGETTVNEKSDTAWSAHLKRNNSFITKLFHGQLMSKLTCAACHKTSYSYDPCAQISLPIPSCKTIFNILLFTRDPGSAPLLITLPVATPNAQVWHLINMLQAVTRIPAHFITLFDGYTDVCLDERASIASLQKCKYLVASEVSKDETNVISLPVFQYLQNPGAFVRCDYCGKAQSEVTSKLKRCTRCYVVAYCSKECQSRHWQAHCKVCSKDSKMQIGLPFFITFHKDAPSFEKFEEDLRERATYSVQPPSTSEDKISPSSSNASLSEEENKRKSLTFVTNNRCLVKVSSKVNVNDDTCMEVNSENFSAELLTKSSSVIIEWQNSLASEGDTSNDMCSKDVPTYQSYEGESNLDVDEQCTLYDCLRLFMEPERLDESESWKCPKCKSLQSAKKEMAISSPPCLLLLHLKRFTYGQYGQKINKAVTYPLSNFDLSQFIAKETRSKFDYPLLYDLCGVITHRGTMRMGHYTCMVRMVSQNDEEEIGWRNFDDDFVTKIKNEKVISPDAYVLVYRLHGTQDILKMDKCPLVSNHSPATSMENVSLQNVRKRADSVASSGKSPLPERRSVSEHMLSRMKRSVSTESANASEKNPCREESNSPMEVRRCASAVPMVSSGDAQALPGTWSDSLPNITHFSENAANAQFSSLSQSRVNGDASPSFSTEVSCESFEHLNINADSAISTNVVWVDPDEISSDESKEVQRDGEAIDENDLD